MPKKDTNTTTPRFQVVPLLAQQFIRDYEDSVKQYELPQQLELTEHLLHVLGLFRHYGQNEQDNPYEQYKEQEEVLLKRYGKTLKPYRDKQFYKYFDFETVLSEKDIYSEVEFNSLTSDEQGLTVNEIDQFIKVCYNSLYNAKVFLYLRMDPVTTIPASKETLAVSTESDKDITKARQLLAIYYLLKAGFAIEHRDNHSVSAVARFAHLLTGTRYTNLQNSDIYKKYSLMPHYKTGVQLIADLQFIRPFFADLNIQDAIKLIDEEIHLNEKKQSKK